MRLTTVLEQGFNGSEDAGIGLDGQGRGGSPLLVCHFLNRLARTAEQLRVEAGWAITLSVAFAKWLQGTVLDLVVEGDQMLLHMLA
jgi:hypothetical protein